MAKSDLVVGRERHKRTLDGLLESRETELLALYGRRRVGKTHLIREYLAPRADLFFAVTGQKDAKRATQLFHFRRELERVFYGGAPLPELSSWEQALGLLCDAVEARAGTSRAMLLFFDELPWLATKRSGFLQSFDYFWNTRLSRVAPVRCVLCGSAASWMLERLIHAKGGLHNRITRQIRLDPFSLHETAQYLKARRLRANHRAVLDLYMALGGVPYYLRLAQRGRSSAQNVGALCFDRHGELSGEFEHLFSSLFEHADAHERIVRAMAARRAGVLRNELVAATSIASGGRLNRHLRELEDAGFIAGFTPYGRKTKDTAHRLIDEFAAFHLKWIEPAARGVLADDGVSYWLGKSATAAWRAWSGYAFEGICLKHAAQIRAALGISTMAVETGTWRYVPARSAGGATGAQVDLLFDRADGVIDLCEIKYSREPYVITKAYARELKRKVRVFEERTRTRKQVRVVLVTAAGLKRNTWSEDLVDHATTADCLFAPGGA